MFSGRYEYTLDNKSRVSVPAKFRETLSARYDLRLVLTNLDGCVVAYPYQEWLNVLERNSNRESITREARTFLRFFYSGATECSIDKLGRILLPQSLKNYAHIVKDVVIIGMNRKIEMWAAESWEELVNQATSDPELVAKNVSELGL